MRLIALFVRSSPRSVVLAALMGLASGLAMASLVAHIAGGPSRSAGPGQPWSFLGLCALTLAARLASERLVSRWTADVAVELRMALARRILAAPLLELEARGSPRLLTALTETISQLAQVAPMLSVLLVDATIVAACLVHLGSLSPRLLLGVGGFVALGAFSYRLLMRPVLRQFRAAHGELEILHGHLSALAWGHKQLKLDRERRATFAARDLEGTACALADRLRAACQLNAVAEQWGAMLFLIGIGLVLFLGPGVGLVRVDVRAGATVTLLFLLAPLWELMWIIPHLGRAAVALRILEELGFPLSRPEPAAAPPPPAPSPGPHLLELQDICFSYARGGEPGFTLGPLELSLRTGEVVFVVGGNGSGKSTLVKVLSGLYLPDRGQLVLDGQPIVGPRREWLQQHLCLLFADPHVFRSLDEVGGPDREARARELLARVHLEGVVHVREGGFSTTTALSHGQRKRLALVVALLEDRPFYVMDEWAAEQDPAYKEWFYRRLLPELRRQGKAVLVISHDDRYFPVADRILELREGRLESLTPAAWAAAAQGG